jgi:hypothetical protein
MHEGVKKGKAFQPPAQRKPAKVVARMHRRDEDFEKNKSKSGQGTKPGSQNRHKIGGF